MAHPYLFKRTVKVNCQCGHSGEEVVAVEVWDKARVTVGCEGCKLPLFDFLINKDYDGNYYYTIIYHTNCSVTVRYT